MKQRWFGMLLALGLIAPIAVRGAEEVSDYFTHDWYVTEVIVFQRPAVLEFNTVEKLLVAEPRAYPLNMRSLFTDPRQVGAGYLLDPATLASLELEFTTTRAPATFRVPDPTASLALPAKRKRDRPTGDPPPTISPVLGANALLDFLSAVADYEATLTQASYRWAPTSEHMLRGSAAVLTRRFNHQVLLHGRWVQPVPPRDAADPLYVQVGPRFSDTHLLEGTLGVTLGRYLHFRAQLVYREPGFGQAPISLPHPVQQEAAIHPPLPAEKAGYMVLAESRRMRSEEVHYLDHPKLGIIVRIDPVAIPEALQLRFQALQESTE